VLVGSVVDDRELSRGRSVPSLNFLNVGHGDCTWIKHGDGRNTVVDVCHARSPTVHPPTGLFAELSAPDKLGRDFGQKAYPVNPIEYLQRFGETQVHRFILTHPDMDHMDGIEPFFRTFAPINFWDTDNRKVITEFGGSRFAEDDWRFYRSLRDRNPETDPKRLALFSGATGPFYNVNDSGQAGGNGLHVLAPTASILRNAIECDDYNDCSYVLLWRVHNKKVILGGDSHDVSWAHILQQHRAEVSNIDLLIAPHHGRDSDRSYDFLDVLRPKLTFFGVARSEHLGYQAWRSRGLEVMTNNMGNCFVVDFDDNGGAVYCTNPHFARVYCRESFGGETFYSSRLNAWYLQTL
jgi:competence protein ComEC